MDEQTEELAGAPVPAPAARSNRGWFGPGDRRINREGRPRGSKAAAVPEDRPAQRRSRVDRLKLLFVSERVLACCLTQKQAPWLVNMPTDFRVVECRVDESRGGVVLTIRSGEFPRVARGAPIPEFEPAYRGLTFCRLARTGAGPARECSGGPPAPPSLQGQQHVFGPEPPPGGGGARHDGGPA
jgi:hypothetical protein